METGFNLESCAVALTRIRFDLENEEDCQSRRIPQTKHTKRTLRVRVTSSLWVFTAIMWLKSAATRSAQFRQVASKYGRRTSASNGPSVVRA